MAKVFCRAPYNYDTAAASNDGAVVSFDESKTQQSQAEEADINTIVKRFGLTGRLPENIRVPTYGDFVDVTDYKSAMDAIAMANTSFMELPPDIRSRFHQDPQEFLDFCSKAENLEEMRTMGLALPAKPDSSGVQGAQPPASAPAAPSSTVVT